jgi:hypothetical protein
MMGVFFPDAEPHGLSRLGSARTVNPLYRSSPVGMRRPAHLFD